MRRACVYFFFDSHGRVDGYVLDMLQALSRCVDTLLVVSNGPIDADGLRGMERIPGVSVHTRANEGFDVWAYRHGLEALGWDRLGAFDEVILANFTVVGPVYPLDEAFEAMARVDVDFWGLTRHAGTTSSGRALDEAGVLPRHLQTPFIVVRRAMATSEAFREYWRAMRPVTNYEQAVAFHELVFTEHFSRAGFRWSSYVDSEDLERYTPYPLMFMPREIIGEARSPVFKRKALMLEPREVDLLTAGAHARGLIEALDAADYDMSRVVPSVIRDGHQAHIRTAVRPLTILTTPQEEPSSRPLPIVAFVDSRAGVRALVERGPMICSPTTVLVACRDAVAYARESCGASGARVVEGTIADVIDHCRHQAERYGAVAVAMFAGYPEEDFALEELESHRLGVDCLLGDGAVGRQAAQSLAGDALVGAYLSLPPWHGRAREAEAGWGSDFVATDRVLSAAGVQVPRSPAIRPDASPGGVMWIAAEVLASADLDAMARDLRTFDRGRASRLFALAIPFLCQHAGLLASYAAPPEPVERSWAGTRRQRDRRAESCDGPLAGLDGTAPGEESDREGLFYYAVDGVWGSDRVVAASLIAHESNGFYAAATIPEDAECVRFDPAEGVALVCSKVVVTVDGEPRAISAPRARRLAGIDIHLTRDPQYVIAGAVRAGSEVVVTMAGLEPLRTVGDGAHLDLLWELTRDRRWRARWRAVARDLRSRVVRAG